MEQEPRKGICVCGETFPIPKKRGRPPVRCDACREAFANGTLRDRLGSLGIDPDVALRKRFNSDPTSIPQGEINKPQDGSETSKVGRNISVNERLDELELLLKARGLHISQHRDNW